jgi:low affinity Fe/Cu permease
MTLVNLGISNITMIIGQAVLVSTRRDGLAYHLKMDRIIEALPTPNDAIGAEHRDEAEIKAALDQVEHKS